MAQLKDLIVNGASRLIGDVFTNKIQIIAVNAPTASNGTIVPVNMMNSLNNGDIDIHLPL